jgi:hypothetical protein
MEIKKALSHPLNELKVDQKNQLREITLGECLDNVFFCYFATTIFVSFSKHDFKAFANQYEDKTTILNATKQFIHKVAFGW